MSKIAELKKDIGELQQKLAEKNVVIKKLEGELKKTSNTVLEQSGTIKGLKTHIENLEVKNKKEGV